MTGEAVNLENEIGPEHPSAQHQDESYADDDEGVFVEVFGAAPVFVAKHHSGLRTGSGGGDGKIGTDDEYANNGQDR